MGRKKKKNLASFVCFPLLGIQTDLSVTSVQCEQRDRPAGSAGLQLNLQQQAEVFPLGLSWCQRRAPRFLHCGRNLSFPAICQGPFSPFLCITSLFPRTLFSVCSQLTKCEHSYHNGNQINLFLETEDRWVCLHDV